MPNYLSNFYLLFVLLFWSCANITPPGGGPKDTEPPKLTASNPRPGQLNFKGNTIFLEFDENIQAGNIQEQLIIAPFTENPFKSIVQKKRLTLSFQNPLDDNTTYTFNFRESIKDQTEGNAANNQTLSFSTGSYMDSLTIAGNVIDLKNGQPADNIQVSLYIQTDTFPAAKIKPIYLVRTDKSGAFTFQNIKSQRYQVIAIDDKNKNVLYSSGEKTGFKKNIDPTTKEAQNIQLKISVFDADAPKVKTIKNFNDKSEIHFNEGIATYFITTSDTTHLYPILSDNGKILNFYNSNNYQDSIPVTIQLTDSSGIQNQETVKISFEPTKKPVKQPLELFAEPKDGMLDPGKIEIKIRTNKPITSLDTTKIIIQEDTIKTAVTSKILSRKNNNYILLEKSTKASDTVKIIFEQGALKSYDTINQTRELIFNIKQEENYSSLTANIQSKDPNYIIELLNSKYEVIHKQVNAKTIRMNYLSPGTYYLRAIIDTNSNKLWDAGDLTTGKQPELIIFYKTPIELRANWEVRDINFTF